jgi:hypothetical protein
MTIRARLQRLERLVPPAPPQPQEPLDGLFQRPEVMEALYAEPEFNARLRQAYGIWCEAFERDGERPPDDFLPIDPSAELRTGPKRSKHAHGAGLEDCRPEAERIWKWMARTPGFNGIKWVASRRPDFMPAVERCVAVMRTFVRRRFGRIL